MDSWRLIHSRLRMKETPLLLVKQYLCSSHAEGDCLLKQALVQVKQSHPLWTVLNNVVLNAREEGTFTVNFQYEKLMKQVPIQIIMQNDLVERTFGISNYRKTKLIYESGFRVPEVRVYEALDSKNQAVIIKVLGVFRKVDSANDFVKEALLQASICHPNSTTILDIGMISDQSTFEIALVLEKLSRDVTKDIEERKAQPYGENELLSFLHQISAVLLHAKRKGIAHRDIKPDNIFVKETGVFKLGDFGSAWAAHKPIKVFGNKVAVSSAKLLMEQYLSFEAEGTPLYMSPEMRSACSGQAVRVDAFASDIFSLGVTVLEMATLEVHTSLLTVDRDSIRKAVQQAVGSLKYSERLADIIKEMLQIDYMQRPSAAEIYIKVTELLQLSENPTTQFYAEIEAEEVKILKEISTLESLDDDFARGEAYFRMSELKDEENRLTEAIEWMEKAHQIWNAHDKPSMMRLSLRKALQVGNSYFSLGRIFTQTGDMQKAEEQYLKSLSIRQHFLPGTHPDITACYDSLAKLYQLIGRMQEAEQLHLLALCIKQNTLAENHPDIAISCNNISLLYQLTGKFHDSEEWLLKSVNIYKQSFPDGHLNFAVNYHNLALLYQRTWRLQEAEEMHQKSLSIMLRTLPEDSFAVAEGYNNLGLFYHISGKLHEAEQWYLKSLSFYQRSLPDFHPDIAKRYNNLAVLYESIRNRAEAEEMHLKSLSMRQSCLPDFHPEIAMSLNNLALFYQNIGKFQKAREYYLKALNILQFILPENHADIGLCYNNLAILYQRTESFEAAEEMYLKALSIMLCSLPEDHPDIAKCYNNLGLLYKGAGKVKEAEQWYIKSLSIRQGTLPEFHYDIGESYSNLGGIYMCNGKMEQAREMYLKSLSIMQHILPEDHPIIAKSYNNLAVFYQNSGEMHEAEEMQLKSLNISERDQLKYPTEIAAYCNNLASLYEKTDRINEAEQWYLKAMSTIENAQDYSVISGCYNNLGVFYYKTGRIHEAEQWLLKTLDIREHTLHEHHPDLASSYAHLTVLYRGIGREYEAEQMYLKTLRACQRISPEDDPDATDEQWRNS